MVVNTDQRCCPTEVARCYSKTLRQMLGVGTEITAQSDPRPAMLALFGPSDHFFTTIPTTRDSLHSQSSLFTRAPIEVHIDLRIAWIPLESHLGTENLV